MAAPHVAGAAALLLAKGRITGDEVKQRLEDSVHKVPGMAGRDFDPDYGYGRLDLARLLN